MNIRQPSPPRPRPSRLEGGETVKRADDGELPPVEELASPVNADQVDDQAVDQERRRQQPEQVLRIIHRMNSVGP